METKATKAVDAFMAKTQQARELVTMIQAEIDDHMGTNPSGVNWAHVGDMDHAVAQLREIAQFMGKDV